MPRISWHDSVMRTLFTVTFLILLTACRKEVQQQPPLLQGERIVVEAGKNTYVISGRPGEIACLLGGNANRAKYPIKKAGQTMEVELIDAVISAEGYIEAPSHETVTKAWRSKTCQAYRNEPPNAE